MEVRWYVTWISSSWLSCRSSDARCWMLRCVSARGRMTTGEMLTAAGGMRSAQGAGRWQDG